MNNLNKTNPVEPPHFSESHIYHILLSRDGMRMFGGCDMRLFYNPCARRHRRENYINKYIFFLICILLDNCVLFYNSPISNMYGRSNYFSYYCQENIIIRTLAYTYHCAFFSFCWTALFLFLFC